MDDTRERKGCVPGLAQVTKCSLTGLVSSSSLHLSIALDKSHSMSCEMEVGIGTSFKLLVEMINLEVALLEVDYSPQILGCWFHFKNSKDKSIRDQKHIITA